MGRLKAGPERTLVDAYLERAAAAGRGVGLGPVAEREIDPRALKDKTQETRALLADIPGAALVFALDETGEGLSSIAFAQKLQTARDAGLRAAIFLIGGVDGHDRAGLPAGARRIAFGPWTWPHKLARVMLAEQLYRAISLSAGTPYHREG